MHVDGEELTQAQVVAKLQGYLDVYERVNAAKAAYGQALEAQEAMAAQAHAFKVSYGQALRHVLGKASPALATFGISVQQRKTPTAQTQLLANAKRLATRKARGTLGKRQKAKIKGADVASVTVSASSSGVPGGVGSQTRPVANAGSKPALSTSSSGSPPFDQTPS